MAMGHVGRQKEGLFCYQPCHKQIFANCNVLLWLALKGLRGIDISNCDKTTNLPYGDRVEVLDCFLDPNVLYSED